MFWDRVAGVYDLFGNSVQSILKIYCYSYIM